MTDSPRRLVISVDLDEWYHARWATGSGNSRWKSNIDFFREVYGSDTPRGDIEKPTGEILELFEKYGIKATFFILGEVAKYYPHLVKMISSEGHEIASHGSTHTDLWNFTPETFKNQLLESKKILEDLSGKKVIGYRAPNLVIEDWIIPILRELEFEYDSSVCPSRKLMGKFSYPVELPQHPYFTDDISFREGSGSFFEIPIPVYPYIKLPAATGIMTRVIGKWWSVTALKSALENSDALYYFHPYELTSKPEIKNLKFLQKLHSRRTGEWMKNAVEKILGEFREVEMVSCAELLSKYKL